MNALILLGEERGGHLVARDNSPLLKSKNVMLKREDKKVPGRKVAPSNANVFIEMLSRLLASANLCC